MSTKKASDGGSRKERAPSLKRSSRMNSHEFETVRPDQRVLTQDEKVFLLNVERGDLAAVKRIVTALGKKKAIFDLNCVDPLGRSSLVIAIENENLEIVQFLLESGIEIRDALLVAIREDYVDGVECLLRYEEEHHEAGTPYSWERVDQVTANFTPDITPLILAAQRNNYEILKMLLDRGATIPMPHDVKCSCDDCVEDSTSDSLRFSLSRINAYKALASPSLIALSSKDPILTAFELSNELKKLSLLEAQFREEFMNLRKQVQELATGLIDHARTSYELEVLLNHNPDGKPWIPGENQTLERLKLAIDYNQKKFVTHPSVQQLLAAIWYEGLPGFRRLHIVRQALCVLKLACSFPLYSLAYLFLPQSSWGQYAKKPFFKFTCNSASYIFFLFLLTLASQRVEYIVIDLLVFLIPGMDWLAEIKADWIKHERGSLPTLIEMTVIMWVQALIVKELQLLYKEGLVEYLSDMWNLADVMSYGAFLNWIGLRGLSWFMVQKELWDGMPPEEVWIPRDQWKAFDPYLLAEGMFGAGMISSFLKMIHIFSINPYLGPLQVSLGKMVIDIAKWLVLYILVLFSFGCGLNKLLWYYADLERQQCYSLPGGLPDFEENGDSCVMWRRFANLWETSQSLFWASFGLVELGDFELKGIKEFTRFWGLLMFGSYSVCNIIVLLNMLIAMMSNSYTIISERSDMEWKFARSRLWTSYFGHGGAVAAPMNLIPIPRAMFKILTCKHKKGPDESEAEEKKKADGRYYGVVRCLVRRYITDQQRKSQDFNITEDDINEVRQDIRSFRFELINILRMNNMKTPNVKGEQDNAIGRKSKDLERMIQKGFQITKTEGVNLFTAALGLKRQGSTKPLDVFKRLAKSAVHQKEKKDWNEEVRKSSVKEDPIGSTQISIRRRNQSFRRSMLARGNSMEEINLNLRLLDSDQLVDYNPLLIDYTPATRIAYARFKGRLQDIVDEPEDQPNGEVEGAGKTDVVLTIENENIQKASPSNGPKKLQSSPKASTEPEETKTVATPEAKSEDTSAIQCKPQPLPAADAPAPKPSPQKTPEPAPEESDPSPEVPTSSPSQPIPIIPVKVASSPKKEEQEEKVELSKDIPIIQDEPEVQVEKVSEPVVAQASIDEDPAKFDPKGKSVSTGRNITGWI